MINLIPSQLKHEQELRRISKSLSINFALLVIILTLSAGGAYYQKNKVEAKVRAAEERNVSIAKTLADYKGTEDQIKDLNAKIIKIQNINDNKIIWSVIFSELARCVPSKLAVSNISLNQKDSSLTVNGLAESREEIARFKDKLESSSYFQNVYFSTSAYNASSNNYSFSLTGTLEKTR